MPFPILSFWIPLRCMFEFFGWKVWKGYSLLSPACCKMHIGWIIKKLLWGGWTDRSGHQHKESQWLIVSQEGTMRVPITVQTAVIWFKLLKDQLRGKERETRRLRRGVYLKEKCLRWICTVPLLWEFKYILWFDGIFFSCGELFRFSLFTERTSEREKWCSKKFQSKSLLVSDLKFLHAVKRICCWLLFLLTLCSFSSAQRLIRTSL